MMKTHLLKFYVVDVESNTAVAAFMNETIAALWALEYTEKTGRELKALPVASKPFSSRKVA